MTVINTNIIKHINCEELHKLTLYLETKVMEKLVHYYTESLGEDLFLEKITVTLYRIYKFK